MREKTSLALDAKLRVMLQGEAKRRGLSVSQIVNEAAAAYLARVRSERERRSDPLFRRVPFVPRMGRGSGDIDDVVYGEP